MNNNTQQSIVGTITRSTSLNFLFYALNFSILFLVSIILARYLGDKDFGKYSFVISYLFIFNVLADAGVEKILIRELARKDSDVPAILGSAFFLRLVLSVISLIGAIILLSVIAKPDQVHGPAIVASFSILFSGFFMFRAYFQSVLKMVHFNLITIANSLALLILIVVATVLRLGLLYIFLGHVLANIATCVISYRMLRKHTDIRFKPDITLCRRILKDSVYIAIFLFAGSLFLRADQIMLGSMREASQVGLYSAGMRITDSLLIIPELLLLTIFPLMSASAGTSEQIFRKAYTVAFTILAWLFVPVPIVMPLISKHVATLLLGVQFLPTSTVLNLLAWAVLFSAFSPILYNIMVAENNQKHLLWLVIVTTFLNIGLNYALIPRLGYVGSCWARIVSTAVGTGGLVCIQSVRQYFLAALKSTIKPALATLLVAAYLSLTLFPAWLMALSAVTLYMSLLLLFNKLGPSKLKGILKRSSRQNDCNT